MLGLLEIRNKHNISAYQLKKMTGLSGSVISEVETKSTPNPTFGTLHKLVLAFAELGVEVTEGDLVDAEY